MNRLDRLVAVLITIQSRKAIDPDELANKFEVSKRTIYRDIKALSDAGVPVYTEDGKKYRIMDGYFLPPVMITREEASSLLIMEKLAGKFMERGLKQQFNKLATKIKAVLRYSDKDYLEDIDKTILVHTKAGEYYGYKETASLFDFQKAVSEKLLVTITYHTPHQNITTRRTIEPVGITQYGLGWHIIGWCQLRKDYRDFRLDRIQEYKLEDVHFEHRDKDPLLTYIGHIEEKMTVVNNSDIGLSQRTGSFAKK